MDLRRSLLLILILMFSSGCFIESSLTLTRDNELRVNNILISIDTGDDIIEAAVRHALNILGVRGAFNIEKYVPSDFSMESYLKLDAREKLTVPFNNTNGDQIKITNLGDNQYKLTWNLEQRVQEFIKDKDAEESAKVFLVVRITFPGSVEIANTSENDGDTYVWRFTQSQINKDLKITALYSL